MAVNSPPNRWPLTASLLLAATLCAAGIPDYAGSDACRSCHTAEYAAWRGSHHDLAMEPATEDTVLGNFGNQRFEHKGAVTRFFRRDGRFLVETEGADGKPHEYAVDFTFGITPLQQYLVGLPDGRYQALTAAWDSRPAEAGGQRWFHLYPDEEIPPGDELHWTAPAHTWNFACAECHSTNLRKNYDPASDSYATDWSEIDVACEACHGPGSRHVAVATAARDGDNRDYPEDHGLAVKLPGAGDWHFGEGAVTAVLSSRSDGAAEIELCGRCHARRSQLSADYVHGRPLSDTHRVQLLTEGRYFADGQILDEVYVYGSFLQSKMHAAGVTCSDCHEPHSLRLRVEGNGVCVRCHTAVAFDTPKHHFHPADTVGARCVECHMPERTYMVVDPRRDHSMRVPRPDLSVELGVPNACTRCHADQTDQWAAQAVEQWYGKDRKPGFEGVAGALAAGRGGRPGAGGALAALVLDEKASPIARATALAELEPGLQAGALPAVKTGLESRDPLMRRAAVEVLEQVDLRARWQLLSPLLDDPVLGVRIAVAQALADLRAEQVGPGAADKLRQVFDEYLAAQELNADRVEHWVNLGGFHARQGDSGAAEEAYGQALKRDRKFVPAYVNHADLYRAIGNEEEAGRVLQQGLEAAPDSASLHHAYGLWLVRGKRTGEALEALAKAWELAPEDPQIGYVYAVALNSSGEREKAMQTWKGVLKAAPNHRDTLFAMATALRDTGERTRALLYARHLARLVPDNPQIKQLVTELRVPGKP